ncbi:unnamed protein product [Mytilus coruscus]|uniref:Farnesoic acid O-methyl transferase domain-containing protein n=1 Tax=Mytilus coruscus TaxID=42192 RepID=A0A6J7ZXH9_MYTCO|nr:unnamed protein product [Mytilus coruscus]
MKYGLTTESEIPLTCTRLNTIGHLECAMFCAIKSNSGCEAIEIRSELDCCLFSSDKMVKKENSVSSLIKYGGPLHFFTTNTYDYLPVFDAGISFVDNSSIVFEVKTCRGAHIALMTEQTDTGPLYEVVIGGEKNTKVIIRRGKFFPAVLSEWAPSLVDCDSYQAFKVQIDGGYIEVKHIESNKTYNWTDPNPLNVSYVAIASWWNATGEWKFNV